VITIVGNAKNAGKTTVLNTLISAYRTQNIAITSIGLDGEDLDQITRLPKPKIDVFPGMLVATAKETLRQSSADYDVIETLDIPSAMGPIVIVLIRKSGQMLCAGPSSIHELKRLIRYLKLLGVSKIFVDGAFSRQQLSRLGDATILCIGASLSPDLKQVMYKAKQIIEKFSLPGVPVKWANNPCDGPICAINEQGVHKPLPFHTTISFEADYLNAIPTDALAIHIPGAVTDSFVQAWLKKPLLFTIPWIIQSPAHLLCSERNIERLRRVSQSIFCMYPIRLVAICYNPFVPHGQLVDDDTFYQELKSITDLPVFNVVSRKGELHHE
jgi:molybdopterin-guanine dinucleotide biosynthesis protein